MDNAPVNPSSQDDEEYQFTEDEHAPKYDVPKGKSTSSTSSIIEGGDDSRNSVTKKRIIIIIGVIIGAFCLYKLYGLFTAPAESAKTPSPVSINTQPKTAVQTATPAVLSPSAPLAPPDQRDKKGLEPMPSVLSQKDLDKENTKQKISSLEKAVIDNGKAQENLQNEIAGMTSAITEIQSNIAMLTQQINTLVQQKNEAEAKLALNQKEKAKENEKTKEKNKVIYKTRNAVYSSNGKNNVKNYGKKQSYGNYYIKALIQGRAWLINTNGETSTVSVGDQLSGYGQIQEINPSKGVVMTSSGRVISFMPQDR